MAMPYLLALLLQNSSKVEWLIVDIEIVSCQFYGPYSHIQPVNVFV